MNPLALDDPAVEPITLSDMKAYLRLDGQDEDDLVSALITAGRITAERSTRLALIEQGWRLTLTAWPPDGVVILPFQPVIGVEAVRLLRASDPPLVLDGDQYRLDGSNDPARLLLSADAQDGVKGLEIDVLCGFGASPAAIPEPLRAAIRRLVAYWFEHRGDDGAVPAVPALPTDVLAMLAPFRRPRLA